MLRKDYILPRWPSGWSFAFLVAGTQEHSWRMPAGLHGRGLKGPSGSNPPRSNPGCLAKSRRRHHEVAREVIMTTTFEYQHVEGGVPIKMWTRGVPVEDGARDQPA